jgi:hypothetical protein
MTSFQTSSHSPARPGPRVALLRKKGLPGSPIFYDQFA